MLARDGHVDAVGEDPSPHPDGAGVLDGAGGWLLPGFVDAHIHGAYGEDVMAADAGSLRRLSRALVRHGVTAYAPTLWAATRQTMLAVLGSVAEALGAVECGGTVLGAHVEGPYLSGARCGAQDPRRIRPFDPEELREIVATGAVARMTVAPEAPGNEELVATLVREGLHPSIGHSDADAAAAGRAFAAGARGVTHLFNAMPPLRHREPGLVGAALADERVVVELIADGVHVHPVAVDAVWAAKGPDGLALVSDALPPAAEGPGPTVVDRRPAEIRDGAIWLDRETLAGSCLTLDVALRNLASATGCGPVQLWPTVSRTPARLCGVDHERGDLVPGLAADAVLLDDELEVVATVSGGEVVHDRRRQGGAPDV